MEKPKIGLAIAFSIAAGATCSIAGYSAIYHLTANSFGSDIAYPLAFGLAISFGLTVCRTSRLGAQLLLTKRHPDPLQPS